MDRLSPGEYYQFMLEMLRSIPTFRNFIISAIFDQLMLKSTTSMDIISTLHRRIWCIMKCRVLSNPTASHINLDRFEASLLNELSSYLDETDLKQLYKVNRATFVKCNRSRMHCNKLHKLIQLRIMMDKATDIECEEVISSMDRNVLSCSIFNGLHRILYIPFIDDYDLPHTMNGIILNLIQSRSSTNHENEEIQLTSFPYDIIGEIASYLHQMDYFRFCICNRALFVMCNTPNKLQQLDLKSDDISLIKWQQFPSLQQITMDDAICIHITNISCIIHHLLNVECERVRDVTFDLMKYLIVNITRKLKKYSNDTCSCTCSYYHHTLQVAKTTEVIDAMIHHLQSTFEIAQNKSLIDNDNCAFPEDLKNYTERKPKLDKYWLVLSILLQLFPRETVEKLIIINNSANWKLCIDILVELEDSAATYMWAKNDDKLLLMKIMIRLIELYGVSPHALYDNKLIEMLTSHFLVSTRSKYVSHHMEQSVCVTFGLLTHFVDCDNNDWISKYLLDSYWFLWSLTDIVTPHHVFGSSDAAHCIIAFVDKIIDLQCMKSNVRHRMIRAICKKWSSYAHDMKWSSYPRDTVFKLLMIIIKTEADHTVFLEQCDANTLIKQWVQNYFFSDILDYNNQQTSVYNTALDFFQFHITAAMRYTGLNHDFMAKITRWYMMAICAIYSFYFDAYKSNNKWQCIFDDSLRLLRSIIDLNKVYKSDKIVTNFVNCLARSELMIFPWKLSDYNCTKNSEDTHVTTVMFLNNIISMRTNDIKKRLERNTCDIENECMFYCDRISRLFEIGISSLQCIDNVDERLKSYLIDIMVSCWYLTLIGNNKLPDIVSKYIFANLSQYANDNKLNTTLCVVLCCVVMTSGYLRNQMFCDPFNQKIFVCLTNNVFHSIKDKQMMNKSQTVHQLKLETIRRYLPIRFQICIEILFQYLRDSKYSHIKRECYGFIQYYCHVLKQNQFRIADVLSLDDDDENTAVRTETWWKHLCDTIHDIIQYLRTSNEKISNINNNNEHTEIKTNLSADLETIKSIIVDKLL